MKLTKEQKQEIADQQALRIKKFLLDYGFVRVVDYMGDDSSIVQSARVCLIRKRCIKSFNRRRSDKIFNETLAFNTI